MTTASHDLWLQRVADAHARGDQKAVNWLTASWMPFTESQRSAARSGVAPSVPSTPASLANAFDGAVVAPVRIGRIVFANQATVESIPSVDGSPSV